MMRIIVSFIFFLHSSFTILSYCQYKEVVDNKPTTLWHRLEVFICQSSYEMGVWRGKVNKRLNGYVSLSELDIRSAQLLYPQQMRCPLQRDKATKLDSCVHAHWNIKLEDIQKKEAL